jgi:hypothetical protein
MTPNVASLFEGVAAAVPERECAPSAAALAGPTGSNRRSRTAVERSPSGKADYRWAKNILSTQTRRNDG